VNMARMCRYSKTNIVDPPQLEAVPMGAEPPVWREA
jgi:hypothetical protein